MGDTLKDQLDVANKTLEGLSERLQMRSARIRNWKKGYAASLRQLAWDQRREAEAANAGPASVAVSIALATAYEQIADDIEKARL